MKKRFFYIIIFAFITGVFVYSELLNIKSYNVADGLPSGRCWTVFQDSSGYIWIGTSAGLGKFNGITFTNYSVAEGLPYNTVLAIGEGPDKTLWIGTAQGLATMRYGVVKKFIPYPDFKNLTIRDILVADGKVWLATENGLYAIVGKNVRKWTTHEGLVNNSCRSLYIDSKKKIWIGTVNGISVLDKESFRNFSISQGIKKGEVFGFCEDEEHNIWVGSGGGLYEIKENKVKEILYNGRSLALTNKIVLDKDDALWIGTWGNGLLKYKENKFTCFTIKNGLSSNFITDLLFDREDTLWITTKGGGVSKLFGEKFTFFTSDDGLCKGAIKNIQADSLGRIWFISQANGISMYDGKKFATFTKDNGLSSNFVYRLFPDSNGRVWVATRQGVTRIEGEHAVVLTKADGLPSNNAGFCWEDSRQNIWIITNKGFSLWKNNRVIETFTAHEGIKNSFIYKIHEDKKGNIWFCSRDGLFYITPDYNVRVFSTSEGLVNNRVFDVFEDNENKLWFSTPSGVMIYNYDYIRTFTTKNGLVDNSAKFVFQDSMGRIWIATDDGVSIYWKGKFTNFRNGPHFKGHAINCIYEDSARRVWIGTDLGIDCFSGSDKKFFTKEDGLSGNIIWDIKEDSTGNIWFLSNKGIDKYDGKTIESFIPGREFFGSAILRNSWFFDRKNRVWIGTNMGVCRYDPDKDIKNYAEPILHFINVSCNDEGVDISRKECNVKGPVHLLELSWVGLSFNDEKEVRYKYFLEGFDKGWSRLTAQNSIRYTNIPSGEYIFKVLAINHNNVWSSKPLVLKIHVLPKFWNTLYFKVIMVIFIFCLIAIYIRLRIKSFRKLAQVLEEKVHQRTQELEKTIAELESKNLLLEEITTIDQMTGLYNHSHFIKQLKMEMERTRRTNYPLSLMMCDLDYFKHVNDTKGHLVGDQVLVEFARLLRRENRQSDIVARYGGEEFSIILINTPLSGAQVFAEKLRVKVEESKFGPDKNIKFTVSFGLATYYNMNYPDVESFLNAADAALYEAKKKGRNCVVANAIGI